ncbi:lipid carrier (plasmid) [Aminobacter sp. SR38]|uniref:ubiquinone anaerobic biosynthesis accessory factor UbiT n=1 Tax=Aminobacter sp. SR38 TaxID=2774562 RepID=UPI0017849D40|nr:SCP2 sterol-binding domain-containing protein [Aminobacter sp. SR38]QOF75633.1 lipid carrier [Aminobacter sp. SR38]
MADELRDGSLPLARILFPKAGAMPLGILLTRALRDLARRQPNLFDRLGEHKSACFFVDPTDLSFAFLVVPDGVSSVVRVVSKSETSSAAVSISGPILVLLGLLDGSLDGDALFFRRIVSIGGRTEAVLALRNAIDDAELRPADLLGLQGALGRLADNAILGSLRAARRLACRGLDQREGS